MSSDGPLCDAWIFVVDTNTYAGNFERCMCAYMTCQIGDCEVGEEVRDIVKNDFDPKTLERLENIVMQVPDDHGCYRPTTIWSTPGWWNDGNGKHYQDGKGPASKKQHYPAYQSVAIFFDEDGEKPLPDDLIDLMKDRARAYVTDPRMTTEGAAGLHSAWHPPKGLKILGFRLLHRIIKDEEVPCGI